MIKKIIVLFLLAQSFLVFSGILDCVVVDENTIIFSYADSDHNYLCEMDVRTQEITWQQKIIQTDTEYNISDLVCIRDDRLFMILKERNGYSTNIFSYINITETNSNHLEVTHLLPHFSGVYQYQDDLFLVKTDSNRFQEVDLNSLEIHLYERESSRENIVLIEKDYYYYLDSNQENLTKLNKSTSEEEWTIDVSVINFPRSHRYESQITSDSNRIYIFDDNNSVMYSLSKAGEKLWRTVYSDESIDLDDAVLTSYHDKLILKCPESTSIINVETGFREITFLPGGFDKELFFENLYIIIDSPNYFYQTSYGQNGDMIYVFDLNTYRNLSSNKFDRPIFDISNEGVNFDKESVYIPIEDTWLYEMNLKTGEIIAKIPIILQEKEAQAAW